MKASEVYLRAAEIQDALPHKFDSFSCHTVHMAAGLEPYVNYCFDSRRCPHTFRYEQLMAPEGIIPHSVKDDDECHQVRVLALLFMHQIALDDERKRK